MEKNTKLVHGIDTSIQPQLQNKELHEMVIDLVKNSGNITNSNIQGCKLNNITLNNNCCKSLGKVEQSFEIWAFIKCPFSFS